MSFSPNTVICEVKRMANGAWAWVCSDGNKRTALKLRRDMERLFTEHPQEGGETYMQHLWFTLRMGARILFCGVCVVIHGVFPFLMKRITSAQMAIIYRILQARVPDPDKDLGMGL